MAEAIAEGLGVSSTSVEIISITEVTDTRRLQRLLAASGVKIDYRVSTADEVLKESTEKKMKSMAESPTTDFSMASIVDVVAAHAGVEASAITPTAASATVKQ